jgi:hypothetical protein
MLIVGPYNEITNPESCIQFCNLGNLAIHDYDVYTEYNFSSNPHCCGQDKNSKPKHKG